MYSYVRQLQPQIMNKESEKETYAIYIPCTVAVMGWEGYAPGNQIVMTIAGSTIKL